MGAVSVPATVVVVVLPAVAAAALEVLIFLILVRILRVPLPVCRGLHPVSGATGVCRDQ